MSQHHKTTRNMQAQKLKFKGECKDADARCWLCSQPINYEPIDDNDPSRFELDHYYPVSTHPEHQEDPANFRPSHAECNRRRGNKAPAPGLGTLSRDWL